MVARAATPIFGEACPLRAQSDQVATGWLGVDPRNVSDSSTCSAESEPLSVDKTQAKYNVIITGTAAASKSFCVNDGLRTPSDLILRPFDIAQTCPNHIRGAAAPICGWESPFHLRLDCSVHFHVSGAGTALEFELCCSRGGFFWLPTLVNVDSAIILRVRG